MHPDHQTDITATKVNWYTGTHAHSSSVLHTSMYSDHKSCSHHSSQAKRYTGTRLHRPFAIHAYRPSDIQELQHTINRHTGIHTHIPPDWHTPLHTVLHAFLPRAYAAHRPTDTHYPLAQNNTEALTHTTAHKHTDSTYTGRGRTESQVASPKDWWIVGAGENHDPCTLNI